MQFGRQPRLLAPEDVAKAAPTLCEAFKDDLLSRYLKSHVPTEQGKQNFDRIMYECYLRQHIDKGICIGVGEFDTGFETVAVWSAPDSYTRGLETFPDYMDAGFDRFWHLAGSEGREKIFNGLLPLLDETSHRIISSDEQLAGKGLYTLVYLGSLESARGKGNVRAMFDFMFQNFIDKPGEDNMVYLESSAPANIGMYNKFGFQKYETIVLGDPTVPNATEGLHFAEMSIMIRLREG